MDTSFPKIDTQLREYRRTRPFVPFEVVLDNGQKYQVTDPFQFAWDGYKMLVIVPKTGVQTFRAERIVDLHNLPNHSS